MNQFSDTLGWHKSTYFSKLRKQNYVSDTMGDTSQHTFGWSNSMIPNILFKSRKHNYVGDSSQHNFGWINSVITMGDTSQHKFQNQENTTMSVMCQNTLGLKHVWDTHGQAPTSTPGYSTTQFSNHYLYPTQKILLLNRVVD